MMKHVPKIVTLTPSPRWRSSLEFHLRQTLGDVQLYASLDFQQWLRDIAHFQPVVAVLEINPQQVLELGKLVHQQLSDFPMTLFLGLGEKGLEPWLRFLRCSGFADVCLELSQLGRFSMRMNRHCRAYGDPRHKTLEIQIQDSLPWRPVVKNPVSGES